MNTGPADATAGAGFASVETAHVEADILNTYYVARKALAAADLDRGRRFDRAAPPTESSAAAARHDDSLAIAGGLRKKGQGLVRESDLEASGDRGRQSNHERTGSRAGVDGHVDHASGVHPGGEGLDASLGVTLQRRPGERDVARGIVGSVLQSHDAYAAFDSERSQEEVLYDGGAQSGPGIRRVSVERDALRRKES